MAGITLEKDKRIYQAGQPMTTVHLITKGTVMVEYPGGSFRLTKGDVIGICELCFEAHFLSYYALEETSILTYPLSSMDALDDFLAKHADVSRLFLLSMFHQINILLAHSNKVEVLCSGLRQNLTKDYSTYTSLCRKLSITPRTLDNIEDFTTGVSEKTPDLWLSSYYLGLNRLYSSEASKILLSAPGVTVGMLRKGSLDFRNAYNILEDNQIYCNRIRGIYFNSQGNDLFDMLTSLHLRMDPTDEDAVSLGEDIKRVIAAFEEETTEMDPLIASRIRDYQDKTSRIESTVSPQEEATGGDAISNMILQELSGSMNFILDYSELDSEFCYSFRSDLNAFKALEDKNRMDNISVQLRHQLTDSFYTLYSAIFEKSIQSSYIPIPVKMFLYFGYIDENLAGLDNLTTLYNIACGIEDTAKHGVYTFYHWLIAIYNGTKQPSRNEFEKDFNDYILAHKQSGIPSSELFELENNPMNKVRYELQNMFPLVNKMTSGSITTFCPFLCGNSVLKDLNASLVTVAKFTKALNQIKSIDYSAFYRESLDYDNIEIMGKKTIHLEFIPDMILMPNIGIRGIMWQEIEGKKRNTPGRMCCSILHLENLTATMIRLTGEFRWDLCKRIQGSRWNDVSVRSLTSEYYDYVQFYRRSHDLSPEAKEKLKNSLQRAKNSFKEMFIRDYIIWVMFEGNGSPRLNKVARKILLTYCPFPADISENLAKNPLYTELLNRQNILAQQQMHQLDNLRKKLEFAKQPVPKTLLEEYSFLSGNVH